MDNPLEHLFSASGSNRSQLYGALKKSLYFFMFFITLALALIFASRPISPVFSSPPASGHWIVAGTESYYDEIIVLNGNLVVEDGGNLTLRKVVLKMNCTYNGQFNITVAYGGRFYVLEDSVITSADPDKKIGFFLVAPLSTFRMINSELHNCGSDELNLSGLILDSDDAIVDNSLLSHNVWGILASVDGVVIRNNNITANSCGVEVHAGANPTICGNFISLNDWGITTGDGSPTISNNTIISNLGDGVTGFFNASSTISDNTLAENLGAGINCHT
ncbi:MAG: right-handed parallel beta-helix repeat-containing protein, partial [Candidatus Bathyarchaeota archaeon]